LNLNFFPAIDTLKLCFLFYVDIPMLHTPHLPSTEGPKRQGQKIMAVLKRGKVWRWDFVIDSVRHRHSTGKNDRREARQKECRLIGIDCPLLRICCWGFRSGFPG
jgi:hypothetical protein